MADRQKDQGGDMSGSGSDRDPSSSNASGYGAVPKKSSEVGNANRAGSGGPVRPERDKPNDEDADSSATRGKKASPGSSSDRGSGSGSSGSSGSGGMSGSSSQSGQSGSSGRSGSSDSSGTSNR